MNLNYENWPYAHMNVRILETDEAAVYFLVWRCVAVPSTAVSILIIRVLKIPESRFRAKTAQNHI